jgi:hypothetical protein
MSFSLEDLYKSLVVQVQQTITAARDAGLSSTLQYYAWDSRGEVEELPHADLMGLAGWSFRENGGLWEIRTGLTLSTVDDENLFREIKIIDVIHNFWGERSKVRLIDRDSGIQFSELVVSDFDMMPAGSSEKRNYRPIGIELLRTEG